MFDSQSDSKIGSDWKRLEVLRIFCLQVAGSRKRHVRQHLERQIGSQIRDSINMIDSVQAFLFFGGARYAHDIQTMSNWVSMSRLIFD